MNFFYLLFLSSLIYSLSRAHATTTASVFFIDSSEHQYIQTPAAKVVDQSHSLSVEEVGAAVSILLGFAPPVTLSPAGSSKLNKVLSPNPFDRPRAVFTLEVDGIHGSLAAGLDRTLFGKALRSNVDLSSSTADIQLPDEDEVSVVSLNIPRSDYTDKEIADFASWLGGSYVVAATEPLNGVLTLPLGNGDNVNLHLSKKGEREFVLSLLALSDNIRRAMEMHRDILLNIQRRAELIMGCFDGIKALQEEYDADYVAKQGMGLLLATLSKIYDSLQTAYKGQIVGVILFKGMPSPQSETLLNVMVSSHPSPRWLAETKSPLNATSLEVVLVRRTLAWVTGIVLIIATLLGVYFLLNMPLTRDTLLYSNVKLD
ncbi:hypothetical protein SLE2022_256160 [Rubroshorea leprosula]